MFPEHSFNHWTIIRQNMALNRLEEKISKIEQNTMKNNEWQPIETAPKDGTQLLLYCGDECGGIIVGHYGELIFYNDATGDEEIEICWQSGLEKFRVTHWMPLPKPPKK